MNAAVQFADAQFSDSQAAADVIYAQLGGAAPAPTPGETMLSYRVRLARGLQKYSASFKSADLGAVARADSTAFAAVERSLYEQAYKFARTPQAVPDGQLREITKRSASGHMVTEFQGDPFCWMRVHMQTPKRVRISRPDEIYG
jgi:hypothetical protein